MKKFIKYTAALALLVLGSCSEETLIDEVFEGTTRGAVLRTRAVEGALMNVLNPQSAFAVTISADDVQSGGLLERVDVFVSYIDNTEENGTSAPAEVLLTSLPASAFSPGQFDLPEATFNTTFQASVDLLGLTSDQILAGDVIRYRLELNLTDGRMFTNNAGGTVAGGSFFSSPFEYRATLVCLLDDYAGDWTFDLVDTFGDGWNNASLEITWDGGGEDLTEAVNVGDFAAGTFVVSVPTSSTFGVAFGSGDFDGEIMISITSPRGNTVFEATGPTAGNLPLDLCSE